MLPAVQYFTRTTSSALASSSYIRHTRFLHSQSGRGGLRRRDWQTAPAYPAPAPLMVSSDNDPVDLSEEEEVPRIPRKPETKLKNVKRVFPDEWKRHRAAVKEAHPEGWQPPKKLSREAMDGLRLMHSQNPEVFTTPVLAGKFRISPEAVRRILKSKWEPTRERRQRLVMREKMEVRERYREERLEERKSGIETIMEKRDADRQETELFLSKQDPQTRHETERQQRAPHTSRSRFEDDRPRVGEERRQRPANLRMPKEDLFFS